MKKKTPPAAEKKANSAEKNDGKKGVPAGDANKKGGGGSADANKKGGGGGAGGAPPQQAQGGKGKKDMGSITAADNFKEEGVSKRKSKHMQGGIVQARGPREVGDWVVKEWQRLPKDMLIQHCQKEKRPLPKFPPAKCEPDKFKCRVILPDTSGKPEKDINLCPEQSFDSEREAVQYASLLALQHLSPTLPLERKLPAPFGDAWLARNTDNPAVSATSVFATQHERHLKEQDKKQRENEKERREDQKMKQYTNVFMSDKNRKFVEDIIDALTTNTAPHTSHHVHVDKAELKALTDKLIKLGFQEKEAGDGAHHTLRHPGGKTGSALEQAALDHLLLTLPEHKLPKQYDPRGRQLEVVANQDTKLGQLNTLLGAGYMGFPQEVCTAAMKQCNGEVEKAVIVLFSGLIADSIKANEVDVPQRSPDLMKSCKEQVEEEMTALESIFEKEYRSGNGFIAISLGAQKGNVEFHFPATSLYPHLPPVTIIKNEQLSAHTRLHIARSMAEHAVGEQLLGTPMIFSLVEWVKTEWGSLVKEEQPFPEPSAWRAVRIEAGRGLSDESKRKMADVHAKMAVAVAAKAAEDEEESSQSDSELESDKDITGKANPALAKTLLEEWKTKSDTDKIFQKMVKERAILPAAKEKQRIVDLVNKNQVVVISGETGCGKSTQVPQFLLEDFILSEKGHLCNVICTQPRRISAVGLAERVAQERAEKCGDTVGYRIRMESKISSRTRLTYVTVGLLLRQLASDNDALNKISHIIIDEVHERSLEIDFLLLILKQALQKRKTKLILMSATLNSSAFSAYFGGCPGINIPGRTFPVKEFYLPDILEMTNFVPSHHVRKGLKKEEEDVIVSELKQHMTSAGVDASTYSAKTLQTVASMNPAKIDLDCIEALVWHILSTYENGGVLVFLPGVSEINRLCDMIKRSSSEHNWEMRNLWIVPLHGSLSSSNQQKVFDHTPKGVRKIVVATNIAETSITVNDVEFVIDSGKMKQVEYDASQKLSLLVESWVSKANATQRQGRAGRVKPGYCFRMFSHATWATLPMNQEPEIRRSSLDHVCLQIKLLNLPSIAGGEKKKAEGPGDISRLLNLAIEPPASGTIESAIKSLQEIAALTPEERLTPLGHHLARLPISNTRIGKLLLMGCLLGAVTPVVRIAALLSNKSPFVSPPDKRDEANAAKQVFTVARSDHLTLLKAYEAYLGAQREGNRAVHSFCNQAYMKQSGLEAVDQMVDQYLDALIEIGFIHVTGPKRRRCGLENIHQKHDLNSSNNKVVSAALCAGLYPNIIKVKHPVETFTKVAHGTVPVAADAKQLKYSTKDIERVWIHPRSVNFSTQQYECPFLVYSELMDTGKLWVNECSMVDPYPLLLFGGDIDIDHEASLIIIDKFIKFKAVGRIGVLVRQLRTHLHSLLQFKIQHPHASLNGDTSPVLQAIIRLITTNGF